MKLTLMFVQDLEIMCINSNACVYICMATVKHGIDCFWLLNVQMTMCLHIN